MATPDELRATIAEARETLRAALEAAKTGDWEKNPEGAEGEAAWSAREIAQHVIPSEAFFATAACKACGYPGVEFSNRDYPDAAAALAALVEVIEVTNKKIKYVSDTDVEKPQDGFGTVEALLAYQAIHLNEHAAQLRSAAGV